MKATDAEVILAYKTGGSVYKAGRLLGMNASSVHERLKKLGVSCTGGPRPWNDRDFAVLRENYQEFADEGRVKDLAKAIGRTEISVHLRASQLGLTNHNRPKKLAGKWKYMTDDEADAWFQKFSSSKVGVTVFMRKHGLGVRWHQEMMERFPGDWDVVVESKATRTSRYRLGREVEYAAKRKLERFDYFVLRSPASKGAADLVALRLGEVLVINCKRNLRQCGPEDWNRTFRLAESIGGIALVAGRISERGIHFMRMKTAKSGKREAQPYEPWKPERR